MHLFSFHERDSALLVLRVAKLWVFSCHISSISLVVSTQAKCPAYASALVCSL